VQTNNASTTNGAGPAPQDRIDRTADRVRKQLDHALDLAGYAIESGAKTPDGDPLPFEDIRTIQTTAAKLGAFTGPEAPGSITAKEWNDFEFAYYRLAAIMNPVTAETLRDTEGTSRQGIGPPNTWKDAFRKINGFLLGFSPAQRFARGLWLVAIGFALFVVLAEWRVFMLGQNADVAPIQAEMKIFESLLPWAYGGLGSCAYLLDPHICTFIGAVSICEGSQSISIGFYLEAFREVQLCYLPSIWPVRKGVLWSWVRLRLVSSRDIARIFCLTRSRGLSRPYSRRSMLKPCLPLLQSHLQVRHLRGHREWPMTVGKTPKMKGYEFAARCRNWMRAALAIGCLSAAIGWLPDQVGHALSAEEAPPQPLLAKGQPVDWWFVFKFNSSKTFAGCGPDTGKRTCIFGGEVQAEEAFGQQFAYASSNAGTLEQGKGCVGATTTDAVGATFDQVYNGSYYYVIWNDQFYRDPQLSICGRSDSCGAPWGHSKGMLAWNNTGDGFVLQVTTPSWPGSGTSRIHRKSGNTLGCISTNNNLRASQHFFALKLTKDDLLIVLRALANASVVTDPTNMQIVKNGGPADVRALVDALGNKSKSTQAITAELSSGVILISKPSLLKVPPWQFVSAALNGVGERAATWWLKPWIYTTTKSEKVTCWDEHIQKPGPVEIALTGGWNGKEIVPKAPSNHAKIGVSTDPNNPLAIFGDLNQQGTLTPPNCGRSQNGRGGLFYVVKNKLLSDSLTDLLEGDAAPTHAAGR
jgi:hypothetical protein